MPDEAFNPLPPELQALLDLHLTIKSLISGVEQQRLEELLSGICGMESVSFFEDKIAIRYDPEQITEGEISARISSAGFSISAAESATPAPCIDSP